MASRPSTRVCRSQAYPIRTQRSCWKQSPGVTKDPVA